jgi:hypothetical protein
MHLKYISVTEGYSGHRFCEPNHNLDDQYNSDQVFVHNLKYTFPTGEDFPGILSEDKKVMMLPIEAYGMFNGTEAYPFSSACSVSTGWQCRPFHPKFNGHIVIKDALIKQLKADKVPGVQTS